MDLYRKKVPFKILPVLRWLILFFILLFLAMGAVWLIVLSRTTPPVVLKTKTIADRLDEFGAKSDAILRPAFLKAGINYPPKEILLLALKQERRLDLFAASPGKAPRHIKSYTILAASGVPGPKLREGDRQVPEGFYHIDSLNPNSAYHLSLRVSYPNADDFRHANQDGRDRSCLGGDIMIHGGGVSIGCVAIGDPAIEEIFVLAARAGAENIRVIISPCDFRTGARVSIPTTAPEWTEQLHAQLRDELQKLPTTNIPSAPR